MALDDTAATGMDALTKPSKRKRGRPILRGEPSDVPFTLYITRSERATIAQAAKLAHHKRDHDFARLVLIGQCAEDVEAQDCSGNFT
jgi:hypothetical protein